MAAAMAHFSEKSIAKIRNLLAGKSNKKLSGALKRKMNETLGPYRGCYKEVSVVDKVTGETHTSFFMADVRRLLALYVHECPSLHALLKSLPTRNVEAILAEDEATAGNVLNPQQRMKTLLVYFTIKPLAPWFESSRAWMPLAALTHEQLQHCPGGASAVTACIVEELLNQKLSEGFAVASDLPEISLTITGFISDMEGQRAAYASKGSAALRPCLFCGNCLMKGAHSAEKSDKFFTIEEADLARFVPNDPRELEEYIVHWMVRRDTMTKKELEVRQTCLGYQLNPNTLWGYPRARQVCNIGIAINDAMHCYWANGICSSELALVLKAAETQTGITLQSLCDAMLQAGWKRHNRNEGTHWCKRLWTRNLFGAHEYKGSATQCHALMALVRWYCETLWLDVPVMRDIAQCFLALGRCTDALRIGKRTQNWSDLDARQKEHHALFERVHPGCMRPKHHHRLHLGDHYRKHHVTINCWGIEQSHQNFKGTYAENFYQLLTSNNRQAYSQHLMPRLLLRAIQICREHPFQSEAFALTSAFTVADVEAATDLRDAEVSGTCSLRLNCLQENSIILWGKTYESAGVCRFFARRDKRVFVYLSLLELAKRGESYRCFRMIGVNDFVPMDAMQNLHIPAFTCAESAKIICLL